MSAAIQQEVKPRRIQRSRKAGSKLPPNTICCTRPGKHGNPFVVGMWFRNISGDWRMWTCGDSPHFGNEIVGDLEHSLRLFDEYSAARVKWDRQWLEPLRNADFLACWCRLESKCHVDIILRRLRETVGEGTI
jgi:hypothetical protein